MWEELSPRGWLRGTNRAHGVRAGPRPSGRRGLRSGLFVGDDVCLARGRPPPACWRGAGAMNRAPPSGGMTVRLAMRLLRKMHRAERGSIPKGWAIRGASTSHRFRAVLRIDERACFRAQFAGAFGRRRTGPPVTLEHRCRPFGAERWVATDSSESGRDEAGDRAPSGETDRLRGAPSGFPRRLDRILRDSSQARPRSTGSRRPSGRPTPMRPILVCPSGRPGGLEA
jgi:hypothetical protein